MTCGGDEGREGKERRIGIEEVMDDYHDLGAIEGQGADKDVGLSTFGKSNYPLSSSEVCLV